jgi:16S rRNA (cytosine1402-N4)-methyltransferase
MTFGAPREGGLIARDVVNHWSEESLTSIFSGFGEERYAKALARAIVDARTHAPIETSGALARIIERALPRRGKIHPATRIFQAIRIAVNDEFGALHEALPKALAVLAPSRRLAVISFHSGEDRIVKNIFRAAAARGEGEASKKPIIPTRVEITENARARSAKLRLFIKK